MRVRLLFGAASVAAVVGMLWGSVTPARACTCVRFTPAEAVERAQVILVGDFVSWVQTPSRLVKEGHVYFEYGMRTKATIHADRYLKGRGPAKTEVLSDTCVGSIATNRVGGPHLLLLLYQDQFEREPTASGCLGSGPVDDPRSVSLAELEAITGTGKPPDDSLEFPMPADTSKFPVFPAVALAVLGPVAFLGGAAFLWRRSEPHSG